MGRFLDLGLVAVASDEAKTAGKNLPKRPNTGNDNDESDDNSEEGSGIGGFSNNCLRSGNSPDNVGGVDCRNLEEILDKILHVI